MELRLRILFWEDIWQNSALSDIETAETRYRDRNSSEEDFLRIHGLCSTWNLSKYVNAIQSQIDELNNDTCRPELDANEPDMKYVPVAPETEQSVS